MALGMHWMEIKMTSYEKSDALSENKHDGTFSGSAEDFLSFYNK